MLDMGTLLLFFKPMSRKYAASAKKPAFDARLERIECRL